MTRGIRTWAVIVMVAASLLSAPAAQAAEATPPGSEKPRVLVFGDSISASNRYRAKSSDEHILAWWAIVAQKAGIDPTTVKVSAEAGSGLVARGGNGQKLPCTGSTFGDRLDAVDRHAPDVILVEVGRNDVWKCVNGRRAAVSNQRRAAVADRYFGQLARAADRQGVGRSNVYVFTAWGATGHQKHAAITTLYSALARDRGFSWIPVAPLARKQTLDGVHPNGRGSRALAERVVTASDVTTAIASRGLRRGKVATGAKERCRGTKACRALGFGPRGYSKSGPRIWGTPAWSTRNYVAHRVTRGRAVAPVLAATRPAQWREEAVSTGAAEQSSTARPGDVAWWETAPAGNETSRGGHLAVVEKVAADNSWVIASEVTSRGKFRAVRYSAAALPGAYLRFKDVDGSPRGTAAVTGSNRRAIVVSGRAVDTDALHRRVRVRVTVTQGKRTRTRTFAPSPVKFSHRLGGLTLKAGKATVRVRVLDTPGTRGSDRTILKQRITIR